MQIIEILLRYIIWHEFLTVLDAKSDFDKKNCHKKSWSSRTILILSML